MNVRLHSILLLSTLLYQTVLSAQITQAKLDYIDKFKYIAIEEMQHHGIPASITLAQGILESNSGKSPLATEANNHFGIKCHKEWTGRGYYYDDDKANECFRIYDNAEHSYRDHSEFLKTRSRYAFLFELKSDDYKSWARGLKSAGYATNPQYAELLIKSIEELELHRFDHRKHQEEVLASRHRKEKEVPLPSVKQERPPATQASSVPAAPAPLAAFPEYFIFNGIKAIRWEGHSLAQIAAHYRSTESLLREYNDLAADEQPEPGENIYLQPKRKRAEAEFHKVAAAQSLRDIAQLHGIRLARLLELNRLSAGEQVAIGETLYLRKQNPQKPATAKASATVESGRAAEASMESLKKESPAPLNQSSVPAVYTVQEKETLYGIGRRFGIPVAEIIHLNALTGTELKPGQQLKLLRTEP